ncbi:MAG TPA: acyl-CoA synthetase FdrA, partial [Chloroflexota bacterium]|nr:acyl-CoA synthetase FdrA [Chloroflexota bacterium]
EAGLLADEVKSAGANDLVVVIEASSAETAQQGLARAEALLSEAGSQAAAREESVNRTMDRALRALPSANMALISIPGMYAKLEAAKALNAGMNVFLFSDNVTLEEELELKQRAVSKGLLMMGPGCGTANINGIALAFGNVIRRGPIGLVGASGTGLQEVTTLIDRAGSGITQAIGVGGRDLSETIGGLMMRQGISMLAADPDTRIIVLISKPPAETVVNKMLDAARAGGKPVVVCFLGGKRSGREGQFTFTTTLEEATEAALRLVGVEEGVSFKMDDRELDQLAAAERMQLSPGQLYLRGLYSGGTLCDEAMWILSSRLPAVYSNIPLRPEWALEDAWHSRENCFVDMGDEEFTRGRPHPMLDPRLRQERILKEAENPTVAVILLDVVIGYGSHADPAGALAGTIQVAKSRASAQGRYLSVVAHVCGTQQDYQSLQRQEQLLRDAGVLVLPTNSQAARVVAAVVAGS